MVVRHYREDFHWLGYSTNPAELLPKRPTCERRAVFAALGHHEEGGTPGRWDMGKLALVLTPGR